MFCTTLSRIVFHSLVCTITTSRLVRIIKVRKLKLSYTDGGQRDKHINYQVKCPRYYYVHFTCPLQNYCEQDAPSKSGRRSQRAGNSKPAGTGRRHEKSSRAEPTRGETGETVMTKKVRGFSDSEIRRFVKSYRKFGKTKSRYGYIPYNLNVMLILLAVNVVLKNTCTNIM